MVAKINFKKEHEFVSFLELKPGFFIQEGYNILLFFKVSNDIYVNCNNFENNMNVSGIGGLYRNVDVSITVEN